VGNGLSDFAPRGVPGFSALIHMIQIVVESRIHPVRCGARRRGLRTHQSRLWARLYQLKSLRKRSIRKLCQLRWMVIQVTSGWRQVDAHFDQQNGLDPRTIWNSKGGEAIATPKGADVNLATDRTSAVPS